MYTVSWSDSFNRQIHYHSRTVGCRSVEQCVGSHAERQCAEEEPKANPYPRDRTSSADLKSLSSAVGGNPPKRKRKCWSFQL